MSVSYIYMYFRIGSGGLCISAELMLLVDNYFLGIYYMSGTLLDSGKIEKRKM